MMEGNCNNNSHDVSTNNGDHWNQDQVRVFLWCSPRTISTAFTKCVSFIPGMEVWSEPFVYCFLSVKEAKFSLDVDLPMELEGNEEIFEKTTKLMNNFTGSNVVTERIVYANLKPRLEAAKSKYVFVKDMCLAVDERTRCYLPDGYRHTFLIRTPERTLYSFRRSYFKQEMASGRLHGEAANEATFDLLRDCPHINPTYNVKDVYDLWRYVRDNIEPNPIVIDADDLLANPKEMMQKYCELVGLPFSESLMTWDSSTDIVKKWKMCGEGEFENMTSFYEAAIHSSCFLPASDPVPRDKMTPDVIKGINETMKYYEEMYEHRIRP